ncbi:MAG: hypothetical protein NTZ20_04875 [Candidatus Levybacteria bacterium]|nr:hypothetical protein [Candidatus Levybacteria bacterium]
MNIFYLDNDPNIAAIWMTDRHVVKMILESAQMLSTAHRILGINPSDKLYKSTHVNHPSNKWIRESVSNYKWLFYHFKSLGAEYEYRYGRIHKSIQVLSYDLEQIPCNMPLAAATLIPCAMPTEYIISDDPVKNYRNYYTHGKAHLHKWTGRQPPEWLYISK